MTTTAGGPEVTRDFRRLAVVNRGEAAMRAINAVREANVEWGTDIRTIALYTDAERQLAVAFEKD